STRLPPSSRTIHLPSLGTRAPQPSARVRTGVFGYERRRPHRLRGPQAPFRIQTPQRARPHRGRVSARLRARSIGPAAGHSPDRPPSQTDTGGASRAELTTTSLAPP